jgi:hypothetical protein
MNLIALKNTIDETKRFLTKAEDLERLMNNEISKRRVESGKDLDIIRLIVQSDFPKQSASVKRASMDLTRALSDLRRPLSYSD